MLSMIDFILDLFRDQNHAAAFVADPERAMADAGQGPGAVAIGGPNHGDIVSGEGF